MRKTYYFLFIIPLYLSGCLGIQENYDYDPQNIDNHINKTTWEFIKERQDAFSSMKEAILYSEIDTMLYAQTEKKYTYILLHNKAFLGATGVLGLSGVSSIYELNKENVRSLLLYHIIDGYYHGLGTLNFDPLYVITLWKSPMAVMTLKLNNRASIEQYTRLVINDMAGSSTMVTATTSNIFTTNGVAHVVEQPVVYKP